MAEQEVSGMSGPLPRVGREAGREESRDHVAPDGEEASPPAVRARRVAWGWGRGGTGYVSSTFHDSEGRMMSVVERDKGGVDIIPTAFLLEVVWP